MSTYLAVAGVPIFEFDATLEESREDPYQWTQYPVEAGALISDFGARLPKVFRVRGLVTATPLTELVATYLRVINAHAALVELADSRQEVTLVGGPWVVDVVIDRVSATSSTDTGEALEVELDCHTIERPVSLSVSIPPELLKSTVAAGAAPEGAGGAGAGVTPSGADAASGKTALATLADGGSPYEAGQAALSTAGGLF